MHRSLRRKLHLAVQINPCTGKDKYGDKSFGTPDTRLCHKQEKISRVKNAAGEEVISNIILYFDGIFSMSSDDSVTLNAHTYPVIAYQQYEPLGSIPASTVVYL